MSIFYFWWNPFWCGWRLEFLVELVVIIICVIELVWWLIWVRVVIIIEACIVQWALFWISSLYRIIIRIIIHLRWLIKSKHLSILFKRTFKLIHQLLMFFLSIILLYCHNIIHFIRYFIYIKIVICFWIWWNKIIILSLI